MKSVLVMGGTVFVSRSVAQYFVSKGWNVHVYNRNTKPQPEGVTLIEGDRHDIGEKLRNYHFDLIVDNAYVPEEIEAVVNAVGSFKDYVFISSSSVYPEYLLQPFTEEQEIGPNLIWGTYGFNKTKCEMKLHEIAPNAYILRPPYIHGPTNSAYREGFVFDCALNDRPFYLPHGGKMGLQFCYIGDVCRFIELLATTHPEQHIFNVGEKKSITVREWVELCYKVCGKTPTFVDVDPEVPVTKYFPFPNYDYFLGVDKQCALMPDLHDLEDGFKKSLEWYVENKDKVLYRPLMEYIDKNLR